REKECGKLEKNQDLCDYWDWEEIKDCNNE
ncbi:MAG: hypothetical protein JWQ09_1248, partial [Segetibacter sp.]|nr:hypothetical protein [Segetibacter sp.]